MKFISLAIAGLLISISAFAQQKSFPTDEELEVFKKKLQNQSDSMQNVINKKIQENQQKAASDNAKQGNTHTKKTETVKLPPLDSTAVSGLPKKTFVITELHVYLIDLHSQLKKKLPDAAASANTIANQLGNDPAKLEAAAMHAWQRGATEEAVLLVVDAAKHAGADGLLLANAGALLDMSGLSEKAVPILKTAVRQNPQNGMALNNLGQAYTQLGMRDSAMTYFGRCIRLSPEHPEANNTAGLIELAHGSKSKAKSYFENSIRGGFTLTAHRGLRIIDGTDTRIAKLIRPKVKLPEYFNQFKYKLPAQCENVNDAVTLEKEHQDYRAFLDKLRKKYHALRLAAEKEVNANTMQNLQKRALNLEMIIRPYQILAETMLTETWIEFTKDLMKLDSFERENSKQYLQLEAQLRDDKNAECNPAIQNEYLQKFADLNNELQTRNILVYKKYTDDYLYWNYLGALDEFTFMVRHYTWLEYYFNMLFRICQTKIIEPCHPPEPEERPQPEEQELKEFECPVDVQIPFIVGKITVDCEKFSFKAGEGLVFKYEKKFTGQRQSTMSLGAGIGFDASRGVGGVTSGLDASADMSVFFVFDNMGHLTDGGMQYSAGASGGLNFSAGEKIKIKKNITSNGVSAGWRFGYNSGISFKMEPGPLKGLLR